MKKVILLVLLVAVSYTSNSQTYSYALPKNTLSGVPSDIFNAKITFSNSSASPISVFINRYYKGLPANWYSCFCYNQCNSPLRDTLTIQIQAFSTEDVYIQFRSDSVNAGVATSKFKVNQTGIPNNTDTFQLVATTTVAVGLKELNKTYNNINLYPNPASEIIYLTINNEEIKEIKIRNQLGQLVENYSLDINNNINVENLAKGIYTIETYTEKRKYSKNFIKN